MTGTYKLVEASRASEEVTRIQSKLEQFLPVQDSHEIAMQVFAIALDVDEEIGRILKDPLVWKLYDYDGRFFTPRGTHQFHVAFDGIHILTGLEDSMVEAFFRRTHPDHAIRWLLQELDRHVWVAKRRRLNWEESRTLGLLTDDVLRAIIEDFDRRRRQAEEDSLPMSPEEQEFFKSFEEEMARPEPQT